MRAKVLREGSRFSFEWTRHWTEAQSVRFDRALKILSKEFFLSEERIMAIIRERSKVDPDIHPVPKVRAPRLTFKQLSRVSGFSRWAEKMSRV